jgi:tRNA-splicing ligase RtcB
MEEVKKISDNEWEVPKENGMNVPGRIFASENLLKKIKEDKCLEQVKNVAKLSGIINNSYAMPDAHQGYGFCIGGVAAFDIDKGVISPGGVGYDINCSVRLLATNLIKEDLKGKEKEILHSLFRAIPSGVGTGSQLKIDRKELDEVLKRGAQWAVEKGYGLQEDYLFTEESGKMQGANPNAVSNRAKGRGFSQLGTLGAGNHFLEIQFVDEIFDKEAAKVFGLKKGQVMIMVHCGSRGLGHQVASDYIKLMDEEYGHPEFDRELVNAPIKSDLGKAYFSAMACAANFAFANKQIITHWIREDMKKYFPHINIRVVYDVCHNIAKFESHIINGKEKEVLVMRKGATRSFGPGRKEIPEKYREVGQPVLLPGSMGTSSYVLCGAKTAEEKSFGSTAHGAGRLKSRTSSKKEMSFDEAKKDMEKRGIEIESGSAKGIVEEMPYAYKDIDEVVRVSEKAGLGKIVARLKPVAVMKG